MDLDTILYPHVDTLKKEPTVLQPLKKMKDRDLVGMSYKIVLVLHLGHYRVGRGVW